MDVQKQKHLDHLLGLLQEEAGEIITEISKVKRFGMYEQYTPKHPTNIQRVINEVKDLISIVELLQVSYDINFGVTILDEDHYNNKKEKVLYYEDVSSRLGLLDLGD